MAKSKKKSEMVEEEVLEMEVSETAETVEEPKPEMTQDDIRLVEAILFASASAVDERVIAERFPSSRAALIPGILEHLREQYAGRGVNLVQRDRRWALRTATDLGEQMKLEKEQPRKFTRSAMETMLGKIPQEWVSMFMFLPAGIREKIVKRSAVASTFGGALEMARRGLIELQQEKNYAPIFIRRPAEKEDKI